MDKVLLGLETVCKSTLNLMFIENSKKVTANKLNGVSYKFISLIVCLFLIGGLKAQTVTINVETAGTLSSLINPSKKNLITDLKLIGNLDGADIRYVMEMSGSESSQGKLAVLDLSDANIVKGSSTYYDRCYSKNATIGDFMFLGCTSLVSVTIPNSVTSIGDYAFRGCTSLVTVTISNSVTSIGLDAFEGCTSLVSVTIPNSVTSIGGYAFKGCTSLVTLTIPNSLTSIGDYAFKGCTSLITVAIPNSIISIGDGAFSECARLDKFTVSDGNLYYSAVDGILFNKDATSLILYPKLKDINYSIPNSVTSIANLAFSGCIDLISVTIPNSVTSIGYSSFSGCTGLISVTIPKSVTSIGYSAFYGCKNLIEIHCRRTIPISLTSDCFVNKSTCKLYVPKGSYSSYWAASIWGDFVDIIEEDVTAVNTVSGDDVSINTSYEAVNITTATAIEVSIYNASGQCIYKETVSGEATIPIEDGLYIVKVGNKIFKLQK